MFNKLILVVLFSIFVIPVSAQDESGYPGAVRKTDLPLTGDMQFNKQQVLKKSFRDFEVEGWLSSDSNWYIKGTVTHQRLRCATYSLGVQLGKGNPACLNVEWLTNVQYGTQKKHCNSAPLIHVGGGEMPELRNLLSEATCVRIVTRCSGTCGETE